MNRKRKLIALCGIIPLLLMHNVWASPNVVVSVPQLHSLVSELMQGAGQPVLLLDTNFSRSSELNAFQKSRLITADMVIWAGKGHETPIASTLKQFPSIENKFFTISKFIPLLPGDNYDGLSASRESNRDLKFWSDPKLAAMAIRTITPKLVHLDPDNTELYLDNEIVLLKKIINLEKDIHAMFVSYKNLPAPGVAKVDRYFYNRFISTAQASSGLNIGLHKVSSNWNESSPCTVPDYYDADSFKSRDYYFQVMRQKAKSFSVCMSALKGVI